MTQNSWYSYPRGRKISIFHSNILPAHCVKINTGSVQTISWLPFFSVFPLYFAPKSTLTLEWLVSVLIMLMNGKSYFSVCSRCFFKMASCEIIRHSVCGFGASPPPRGTVAPLISVKPFPSSQILPLLLILLQPKWGWDYVFLMALSIIELKIRILNLADGI